MNTCRSVDSKRLRLQNNRAVFGAFFLRNNGRGMGERAAADVYGRSGTREATIWEGKTGGTAGAGVNKLDGNGWFGFALGISVPVVGQDFVLINVEGFFFVAGHQVDVELCDASFAQAVEFLAVLVNGADHAEAVDDFVADELGVGGAHLAVVEIVVLAAVFDERGERGRKLLGLVFGCEVHRVIGDESGKPADVRAHGFQVIGRPHGGGGHDFYFAEVAAGFLGAFANEAEAPVDQVGVGKLENHAVADASGGAQGFGSVAGDPHVGNFAAGPRKFCGDPIEVNGVAGVQVAEDADKLLEIFESVGVLAANAAGTGAASDADAQTALCGQVCGGSESGGDAGNTDCTEW